MVKNEIALRLKKALSPSSLEVIDESLEHAGHAGARLGGETHFRIRICSLELSGLRRVAAHQKIYALLSDLMNNPIHALAIEIIR